MIARGFKSVGWVAAVGGAALGCYMVSLNVASERAELERIESQILAAKQDIKALETELGTRGRFSQLEHWNAEVLALSAPSADQILSNPFKLASFNAPPPAADVAAGDVRLASAQVPQPNATAEPVVTAVGAAPEAGAPMLRRASLTTTKAADLPAASTKSKKPVPDVKKVAAEPVKLASAQKPVVKKAATPATSKPSLFDGGLSKDISEAARAESKR